MRLLLSLSIVLGVVAACGAPPSPSAPAPVAQSSAQKSAAQREEQPPAEDPHGGGGSGDGRTATAPFAMKPIAATALASELQSIGLDPKNLPPLSKVKGDRLRKVMKLFTKSLGVKCSSCHTEDFSASTPHKRIAEKMWDEFVRGFAMADGSPLFCDSCHQGADEFLDRRDKKALGQWMDVNYTRGLRRADSTANTCASCHGDPFDGDFLKKWAVKARN